MKMLRLATLYFKPNPKKWTHWDLTLGEVRVERLRSRDLENDELQVFVKSEITLDGRPELTSDDVVKIPEIPRKRAERAIETLANYISVSERCRKKILSTNPCVAFVPEDSEEIKWLEQTRGFSTKLSQISFISSSFAKEILGNDFRDRLDGIALFSEVFSHQHSTGQFHELMRVFERAFSLSSTPLIKPLSEFLTSIGYDEIEVRSWFYDFRNPATHARDETFLLESDMRPIIKRVEQAAYDVLFNKLEWSNSSTKRRKVLSLDYGMDKQNKFYTKMGTPIPTLNMRLFDHFGSYEVDSTYALDDFPMDWWVKMIEGPNALIAYAGDIQVDVK